MSKITPIRKGKVTVPESPVLDTDEFTDMPAYAPTVHAPRTYTLRGRSGMDELAQVVGSKRFRDIKRSSNFMPGQFTVWNDRPNGGNNKYWGGYQDVDGDGLAHEFVVRRGNQQGPMIAVNGYTTKQSDWPARKAFFSAYPERNDRKGKTAKSYMQDEYYIPTYEGMDIKEWAIQPGSEDDQYKDEEWNRYKRYAPKPLSPYQAVNKYIAQPALKMYLQSIGQDMKTFTQTYGIGTISQIASTIYYQAVKAPIAAYLDKKGVLAQMEQAFISRKPPNYEEDPNYATEWDKYVFNRKDVKNLVYNLVKDRLLPGAEKAIKHYAEKIKEILEDNSQLEI